MKIPKILIVDDHALLLDGIKKLIDDFVVIAEVKKESNSFRAVEALNKDQYDMLISDYEMPGLNGAALTKAARACQPNIKVLILSMHDESYIINPLISLGINGYLLKKDMYSQLESAIAKILNGKTYFSPEIDPAKVQIQVSKSNNLLSNRELEILKLIIQDHSTPEIAEQLSLNLKTIETHEKNMIRKMRVKNRTDLVKYANEHVLLY
ncbi:response regulator transcription factor [Reichenbachiella sp. MALMAid0571]|uniref:response regulator transcription factor n=1 Tax=Reichenbachiella sp. MALMAid0571 TaxID=3143939 RepID=UPI0032DFF792